MLATGSFDANAGIWKRWESDPSLVGIKGGRLGEGGEEVEDEDEEEKAENSELKFTSGPGLGHGTEEGDGDGDDDEWIFSVVLEGHESEIKSVAWNASGRFLATCSRDKSVWIWECLDEDGAGEDNFETAAVLQDHDGDVKCVAWHPQEDLLASGSYDDCVRLYREDLDDWTCCACLKGHGSTVWHVGFEPVDAMTLLWRDEIGLTESQKELRNEREKAGPRLVSCSDDLTVRIWRRRPKEQTPTGQGRMPSILRTSSIEEDWYEEARLPQRHERAIYACSWSARTGMIASCSGDGKIVLYKERWNVSNTRPPGDPMDIDAKESSLTEWVVVAEFECAHDVYEVNYVTWARRRDKSRKSDDEEMIISTGDDGEVKLWIIEEG